MPNHRIDIKVGFLCNNKCRFCVQGNKRNALSVKPTLAIKRELKDARTRCSEVVFTGGEASLHPDFLELVSFTKSLKYEIIQIQSNGRMFAYRDFCVQTIDAGANEFAIALHGHIAPLHDYLTSAKGSFTQTLQGIRNLKALGQKVITNTVVTKPNFRYLPLTANLLLSLGVEQFQFAFVHPAGTAKKYFASIVPRISLVEKYVKQGLDLGIARGKRVMAEGIPYCFMQNYQEYISENIIPHTEVHDSNFIIKDYTVYRKNEGKKKGPRCKKCKHYSVCEGPWREYPERFGWEEFKPITK